jgi:hexosaminidase
MYRRLASVSIELEGLGLTHEKNVAMLLRCLAGSNDIAPLETLVAVAEPVKEYRRGEQRPTTMLSPLTSLVDAARADSAEGREFRALVDGLLSDAPRFDLFQERIDRTLARWRDVRPAVEIMADRSPSLREHAPLARDLSEVGAAGLEAMSYLSAGTPPPAGWAAARLAALDEAAKPKGALELVVVSDVRRLVVAASELAALRTMSPEAWRAHVDAVASGAEKPSGGGGPAPAEEGKN